MPDPKPSVGRIVHFQPVGEDQTCLAAVVSRVLPNDRCVLAVMVPPATFLAGMVAFVEASHYEAEDYTEWHQPHTWHWPEKV